MKSYPYIGKFDNCVTLFTKPKTGMAINHPQLPADGVEDSGWSELKFKNITREYLEGKCVKIESPEHSELVQKLAFNAGFKWSASGLDLVSLFDETLNFHSDGSITYDQAGHDGGYGYDKITIPLPPKAEPEPKEWPAVGDTVTWGIEVDTGEIIAIRNNVAWVEYTKNKYTTEVSIDKLKKPKTEAEILRDDLGSILDSYILGNEPKSDYIEKIIKLF